MYVFDGHHDREVFAGNRRDVEDYTAGVLTHTHEASTVPDHDYMGWRVSGKSHCTLRKVNWEFDTGDTYPCEVSRQEVVMVEEVEGSDL